MFDTEQFILEVQQRECLWNLNSKSYSDRVAKRNAWEEIAIMFHQNWDTFTHKEKQEKVEDLIKKWRNVRDYYIKERKKDHCTQNGSATKRKKKYNYYDILSFLDAVKNRRPTTSSSDGQNIMNNIDENTEDISTNMGTYNESLLEENSENDEGPRSLKKLTKSMTSFQKELLSTLDKSQKQHLNVTANKHFLLSLLPDVIALNENQSMQFRLGVLNLLNDIKYRESERSSKNTLM